MGSPTLITGPNPVTLPAAATGNYSIIESQLPLVGGTGGHNLLALVAPNGTIIAELDGLATSSTGAVQPIGYFSSTLKVYETSGTYLYSPSEVQAQLASGSYSQIMAQWNSAISCGTSINAENLSYPFLGLGTNSNSVASTLVACMNVPEPSNVAGNATFTPGVGTMLLTPAQIQAIQTQNGVGTSTDSTISTDPSISSITTNSSGSTINVNGGNGTTEVTTIAPSAGGGGVATLTTISAGGATANTETATTNTSNITAISVSGQGAVVNVNNATITVAAGSTVTINGTGDTIQAAANCVVSAVGGGNTIDSGATDLVEITGATSLADIVNANNDAFGGTSVNGQATGIIVGANCQVNLTGSGDGVWMNAGNAYLAAAGGGNSITSGATDLVAITGATSLADIVNANNDAFGGTSVNGLATGIIVGANCQVNVGGNGDGVWANASGISLNVSGSVNSVTAVSGDSVSLGNAAVSDTVNATGATVNFGANAQYATVNGTNTINLATGDDVTVNGGGSTINNALSDHITLANTNGNFDTVNGTGGGPNAADGTFSQINLANNTQANVKGNTQDVWVNSSDVLNLYASGSSFAEISGTSDLTNIYGAGDTAVANINDNGDRTNAYGSGDITHDYGNDDEVNNFGSSEIAYQYGSYDSGYDVSSSDVDYLAAGNTTDTTSGADFTGDSMPGGYTLPDYSDDTGIAFIPKGGNMSAIAHNDVAQGKQLAGDVGMARSEIAATPYFGIAPISVGTVNGLNQLIQSMSSFGAPSAVHSGVIAANHPFIHAPLLAAKH